MDPNSTQEIEVFVMKRGKTHHFDNLAASRLVHGNSSERSGTRARIDCRSIKFEGLKDIEKRGKQEGYKSREETRRRESKMVAANAGVVQSGRGPLKAAW